jgi:phosphoribosylamine--glycine ligase
VPVTEQLHAIDYVGYVDVNCIIDDKGTPWPLEFTMRPGWPCFQIQQVLHKGDPAQWMVDLIDGKDTLEVIPDKIAVGVVVAIPDFPYSHLTKKEVSGVPIYGITPKNTKNIHLCEIMAGEAPVMGDGGSKMTDMMVTAGDYCLVASGIGKTVVEASENAYKVVKDLIIPNSPIYRNDIGERLEEQLDELHDMNFATGMEYC